MLTTVSTRCSERVTQSCCHTAIQNATDRRTTQKISLSTGRDTVTPLSNDLARKAIGPHEKVKRDTLNHMTSATNLAACFHPEVPHALKEAGLTEGLLLDLVLRIAYLEGIVTLRTLADRTKLNLSILHTLLRHMQKEQLCDARATTDDDYEFTLSARGRSLAEVALTKTHYTGPAPVILPEYSRAVRAQALQSHVTADQLSAALSDLVLPQGIIAEFGAALANGGTILLYGPTGNGKTSIAERIDRLFDDPVYVPHAVLVSGQIITVYDSLIHRAVSEQPANADPRWVLCRRPLVKVGGEMRAEMLEPRIDEATRICVGPLQMKANNGVLLIDDFGRQRITPRELLNRWIVPLDRRTDVLSLSTGVSFEIPFEMLVILATNLVLSDLAEDAFLRRLRNKIRIEPLSGELFEVLLRRVCERKRLTCSSEMALYVREQCARYVPEGLRPCLPEDLTAIACGAAKFEQRSPTFEKEDIDRALKIYFGS